MKEFSIFFFFFWGGGKPTNGKFHMYHRLFLKASLIIRSAKSRFFYGWRCIVRVKFCINYIVDIMVEK